MMLCMRNLRSKLIGVALAMSCTWPVLAALEPKPDTIQMDSQSLYFAYTVAAVLLGAVAVASFKSAKRTHLD
jgi:hypothetical protein